MLSDPQLPFGSPDLMKIEKNTIVTLRYKVADAQGKLIDASPEPMAYLHGGYDSTLPKIEAALEGKERGYQTTLHLAPEDGFGERDESLVRTMPKSEFPPGVKVGGQSQGRAGKELRFSQHVTGVRAERGRDCAPACAWGA